MIWAPFAWVWLRPARVGIPALEEFALPGIVPLANFDGDASWVTLLEAVVLGDGPRWDVSGGRS